MIENINFYLLTQLKTYNLQLNTILSHDAIVQD